MTPERLKQVKRAYQAALDDVEAQVTNALCDTFKEVTGKKPSDKFADLIADAIRYEGL